MLENFIVTSHGGDIKIFMNGGNSVDLKFLEGKMIKVIEVYGENSLLCQFLEEKDVHDGSVF